MAKLVKLADIAEKMNVSTVTVSKALSNQKGVGEDLRKQIKEMAAQMGYVSPSAARMQEVKKSYNIGVIVSQKYFNQMQSFYWLMYQELATKATAKNSFTMLEVIQEEDENSNVTPKLLDGDRINGLIVIGKMKQEYLDAIKEKTRVPVVYLDFYTNDETDAVINDNYFGMYRLTQYLCMMGHKKIGYVGTLFATDSITDRYFGYAKALLENGIEAKKDWIINDRYVDSGTIADYKMTLPKDMPTAFACNCDVTALELINVLEEKGYKVPEDISVVGFDNYAFQNPNAINLTTYAVDVKEMARRAIKIIIRKMAGEYYNKGVSIVEGRVIIGDSVKKLN